ncbi:hypothetical protein ABT336_11935 [Micromonospora sp. NPDC000207]|uniref:hypothetical protein n=1 Tax=Micromonospora sp. NPDC000207 TaxID=3154246 RepID=UPI00333272AC
MTADQITSDDDGWGYRTGARFVTPAEWEKHRDEHLERRHYYLQPLTEALAAVANTDGVVVDYRPHEFYAGPLSDAMRDEDDEPGWALVYDRFTAMVLSVLVFELVEAGLLATRGNGDSVDYRLTLPGGDGA